MQRYRQVKPPEYNLSKISVPFTLFYGTKDFLTSPMDFQKLTKELPSCRARYELPNWNHMDFIYNAQVYLKVYSKILQTMQNVSTGM
ncbi:lysosomal acid lipase [Culex quinquefasciatus]|uniref:Lysosomal acid lipase n=1 Tax=Culex quinquefasciatus TaxID=7176 RepID=B0WFU7_CULQU|nr:lysosomal acid lipase [Culex quinquefasciatus]|eukprot:XP_001847581.1 lysosomal acid lipase [Culex quinquefasciatus]